MKPKRVNSSVRGLKGVHSKRGSMLPPALQVKLEAERRLDTDNDKAVSLERLPDIAHVMASESQTIDNGHFSNLYPTDGSEIRQLKNPYAQHARSK